MPFGFSELLVVLIIVLIIFGAGKLPGVGEALGKSIKNFKKEATDDVKKEERAEKKD